MSASCEGDLSGTEERSPSCFSDPPKIRSSIRKSNILFAWDSGRLTVIVRFLKSARERDNVRTMYYLNDPIMNIYSFASWYGVS